MNTLYIINETYTNGYSVVILDFLTIISIFCAISVIVTKNPIVSVLFLIGLFLSMASYLIILGISFIGLAYLLVYVGAVSILFLFILMLINVRISELLSETRNSLPLVLIVALCFSAPITQVLPSNLSEPKNEINIVNILSNSSYLRGLGAVNNNEVSFVSAHTWDANIIETSHITSLGNIMYTNYSIWLILTSIILLLAMVGAIVITIKQKK